MMTEGDLLAPANFGCRKVGGAEGLKAGAGGGAKGRAGEAGAGAGLGDSKGMVNTGRKGTFSGGAGGPKSVGWIKGSPGRGARSQPSSSAASRVVAVGGAMRPSGRLTAGRAVVDRTLS